MEREWQPTPVLLPGKISWTEEPGRLQSMGSLRVGHDWMTSLSLSFIGEGNGNPLQCSCLENLRDRGAWWAAIYGVSQSQTRLKRLSSSSSSKVTKGFPDGSNGKEPAMQETQVQSLGQDVPMEKGMASHSNIIAWRIPWTEDAGGPPPTGSKRVRHYWATNTSHFLSSKMVSNNT